MNTRCSATSTPTTAGEYAAITDGIKGAPEWRSTDVAAADYDPEAFKAELGVQALDASGAPCKSAADGGYEQADCMTLKFAFSNPAPYFHTVMGIWVAYPAKQENPSRKAARTGGTTRVFQIGNGPYVLQNLEPFVRSYFTPNPNTGPTRGRSISSTGFINDSAVAFEAFKNNEMDIVDAVAEDLAVIAADPERAPSTWSIRARALLPSCSTTQGTLHRSEGA